MRGGGEDTSLGGKVEMEGRKEYKGRNVVGGGRRKNYVNEVVAIK